MKIVFLFICLALAGCDKLQSRAKDQVGRNMVADGGATCPSCSRVTDAQFCAMEKRDAASLKDELPLQIDYATKLDGMMVSCSLRFVTLNKSVALKLSMMRPDWQDIAQSQLNQNICENPLFVVMVRKGWTFSHKITFLSGEQINQYAICSG